MIAIDSFDYLIGPYSKNRNMIDVVFIPVWFKEWVRFNHANKGDVIF